MGGGTGVRKLDGEGGHGAKPETRRLAVSAVASGGQRSFNSGALGSH